jgi:hypothetical protein
MPAERAGGLHRDARPHRGRQHAVAVGLILLGEAIQARHAHEPPADAVRLEQLERLVRLMDLRARSHEDHLGVAAVAVVQHVGAALDRVLGHARGVPHGEALA